MADNLDHILQARAVPQASPDLAERIVFQAFATRKKTSGMDLSWLEAVLENFLLPRPQWAFCAVLTLGILVGVNLDQQSFAQDDAAQDLSAVFEIQENFNAGEFL
jgi:hypothetical protein